MVESDFVKLYKQNYNIKHSIYIDQKEATFLDEIGFFRWQFHKGENYIDESQAEILIPLLKGKLLRRKSDIKKLNNFIDRFISSYGPEFRDKWINSTKTAMFYD